jgi:putative aldouronate transport system substrate-binding protein
MGSTRRAFLSEFGRGAVVVTAGLPLLLEACTAPAPSTGAGASSTPAAAAPAAAGATRKASILPTFAPFSGVKPDTAASADGVVPPGYSAFPSNLVKTVSAPVGKGDDFNFYTYSTSPVPPPLDQNAAWQQINKEIGVNLKFPFVPFADYFTKLGTLIAGNDIPDALTMNYLGVPIRGQLDFLKSKCADLTPYLAGDAVNAYPNLANFASNAWKTTIFDNKIYGVPRVANGLGPAMMLHQNLLDDAGVTSFKNLDEFTQGLKAITRPGTQYGLGGVTSDQLNFGWFLGLHRGPNNWRLDGGKLTKDWETDEYRATVMYLRSLWDQGLIHPDTPTLTTITAGQGFLGGKFAMYPATFSILGIYWARSRTNDPNFKLRAVVPFGFDGGKAYQFQAFEAIDFAAVKAATPDRIKEVLGVLNYLAAPFGSQEYMVNNYGVKGVDFDFEAKGNPQLNQRGQAEIYNIAWWVMMTAPPVLYDATFPDMASIMGPIENQIHEMAIPDPTLGLYSATFADKGAVIDKVVRDGVNDILFGRAEVATLDRLVADWKTAGGEQTRAEYQQALQTAV